MPRQSDVGSARRKCLPMRTDLKIVIRGVVGGVVALAGGSRDFASPERDSTVDVSVTGYALLADPLLNKGTAFDEDEREAFGLHGLLPPHVGTLDEQVERRLRRCATSAPTSSDSSFCADCKTPTRRSTTRC